MTEHADHITGNRTLRKRLGKAEEALLEGEEVIDAATGLIRVRRMGQYTSRAGAVIATDRRVVLYTSKLGGYDVQDFAYGLLTSVDHKKGVVFGDLHLNAAGDAAHVSQIPKNDVVRLAQSIRERMAAAHQHGGQIGAQTPQPSSDPHEELRKLAGLRDDGIITEEEFSSKKQQLLGL